MESELFNTAKYKVPTKDQYFTLLIVFICIIFPYLLPFAFIFKLFFCTLIFKLVCLTLISPKKLLGLTNTFYLTFWHLQTVGSCHWACTLSGTHEVHSVPCYKSMTGFLLNVRGAVAITSHNSNRKQKDSPPEKLTENCKNKKSNIKGKHLNGKEHFSQ